MYHSEPIQSELSKQQQKRKVDRFITKYYAELTDHAEKKMKRWGVTGDPLDHVHDLYLIIDRLAFVDDGWQGEIDVLRQSKVRLEGLIKDELRKDDYVENGKKLKRTFEDIDDHAETIGADQITPEEQLIRAEWQEAIEAFCGGDPYKLALAAALFGEVSQEWVAEQFSKHKSTVSRDKDKLAKALREYMVQEGLV
jgi:hypothetical protein